MTQTHDSESSSRPPLVSVITPAYNAAAYIGDMLESVKLQSYGRLEHVVLDDGSTDSTPEILAEYEDEYNLIWKSKPNEGQATTVNKAAEMANGSILIWLNADDILFSKDVVNSVVARFENSAIDAVYGHMAIIDERNRLIKVLLAPPIMNLTTLRMGHFGACVFARKKVALRYRLNQEYKYALDYDQALRMAADNVRFGWMNRVLMGWRRHSVAKSVAGQSFMRRESVALQARYAQTSAFANMGRIPLYGVIVLQKMLYAADVFQYCRGRTRKKLMPFIKTDSVLKVLSKTILPYT